MSESCQMCGMASWAKPEGVRIALRVKAGKFGHRDRQRTVWCCSESCAVQAYAVAEMGPVTHRWPISLAEFSVAHRQEIERAIKRQSNRDETITKTRINSGVKMADSRIMDLPYLEPKNGGFRRAGGRPRKWDNNAEKHRAYRQRRRITTKA